MRSQTIVMGTSKTSRQFQRFKLLFLKLPLYVCTCNLFIVCIFNQLREEKFKVLFLMVRPLRGGGGKGPTTQEI